MDVTVDKSKKAVDSFLLDYFQQRINLAESVDSAYARLWRNTKEVFIGGGKRLRPHLVFVGYGDIDENIVPIAASQELLHMALLIHDDIIDKDDVRHNRSNLNGIYKDIYKHLADTDRSHFAHSAAILAGDLLISDAYQLIMDSKLSANHKQLAVKQLGSSIFEVAGGELLDVEAAFMDEGEYDPMTIYRYKTAGYSFVGPLITGAMLSDTSEEDLENLRSFAINLGIAYQLRDDYLGALGQEEQTGKSSSSDLYENKKTYLIAEFKKVANSAQIEDYKLVSSGQINNEALSRLKYALVSTGAAKMNYDLEQEFIDRAVSFLGKLPSSSQRRSLSELVEIVRGRHK